uniref:Mitochondrial import inner membrane translocase subunit TIM50 n=1 Tax=Meloidogyne incognita TaxID=6306 RepID=A0A914MJF8_MELIC
MSLILRSFRHAKNVCNNKFQSFSSSKRSILAFNYRHFSNEKYEELERQKRQEWHWKGVKKGIGFMSILVISGTVYVFYVYGSQPRDPVTGELLPDEFSNYKFAPFWRVLDFIKFWKKFIAEPSREKLLPDPVKAPYHQPKYTVVLELRNVLVSPQWDYRKGHYFVKRPALDYFIDMIGYPNFELVLYTSENLMNAAPIVTQIDPQGQRINHALFRDCTKYVNGTHVKDLSRLNRDLKKVIYIDWEPAAFQLNPENVLCVPKWNGDMNDTSLVDLAELLKTIHLSDVEDVRPVLQFYSQFDNPTEEFRKRAKIVGQENQQATTTSQSITSSEEPLKKYRGSLFGARRHAV